MWSKYLLERSAARGQQFIFGARHAPVKTFGTGHVARFFQLAGVHAQVAVRRFQQPLQFVKGQPVINGQRAQNPQAQALMHQAVDPHRRLFRMSGHALQF